MSIPALADVQGSGKTFVLDDHDRWIDRLGHIGDRPTLRKLKAAIFLAWEIEVRPGIKMPYLDGVVGAENRIPHVGQRHCHFEFEDWQYYVAAWGRRAGKTYAAAAEILFVLSLPNMRIWIVGPEYDTTDRVFELVWKALVRDGLLGPNEVIKETFSKNSRYIELRNGSWVKGKSAESKKGLKGEQLDLLVIDECAFITREIFEEYLEPCTLDRLGRVMFISTPRGYNWFKEFYDRGRIKKDQLDGWMSSTFASRLNPFMRVKWLEKKRAKTQADTFRREYECSFEEFEGQIYAMYRDRECDLGDPHTGGHLFTLAKTNLPELTMYRAIDIGHRHPTCCLIGGADKNGNVYIMREYYGQPSTLHEQHAKAIRAVSGSIPIFDSVISHDAGRKYGTSKNEEVDRSVADIYDENGVWSRIADTDVLAGIETVKMYIKATLQANAQHPRIYIERGCVNLRKEFAHYVWAESKSKAQDAPERPRKADDHGMDALRYFLRTEPIWVSANTVGKSVQNPYTKKEDAEWQHYGDMHSRSFQLSQQRKRQNKSRGRRRGRGRGYSSPGV